MKRLPLDYWPVRREGAYIVKCASSPSSRPPRGAAPPGYVPPAPTEADRALARAVLAFKHIETTALATTHPPTEDR